MKKMHNPGVQDEELRSFVEDIGLAREPTIRIYKLDSGRKQSQTHFRKQIRVGEVLFSDFSHDPSCIFDYLRSEFGAGTFLLRTVRPNGTYGPSKVVRVGRIEKL
jgi:hypothetical protein